MRWEIKSDQNTTRTNTTVSVSVTWLGWVWPDVCFKGPLTITPGQVRGGRWEVGGDPAYKYYKLHCLLSCDPGDLYKH